MENNNKLSIPVSLIVSTACALPIPVLADSAALRITAHVNAAVTVSTPAPAATGTSAVDYLVTASTPETINIRYLDPRHSAVPGVAKLEIVTR